MSALEDGIGTAFDTAWESTPLVSASPSASSASLSATRKRLAHKRKLRYGKPQDSTSRSAAIAASKAAEIIDPTPNRYLKNPKGWVNERLEEHVWSKQIEIMQSVLDNRYTAVHSCHDSGKSYIASRIMAWWGDVHPLGEAFIVSTAPSGHQVGAIMWRELRRAHKKAHLPGRITLDHKWRVDAISDDELIGYGRKPQDYDADAFQGIHQTFVLVVMDEANGIPPALYNAVDTIVTNEHSRVLAIGNPDDPESQFAKVCQPGSGWNVIHISGFDTPNFTGEWVPQKVRDLLLSQQWVEERKKRWGVKSPIYISKVLGKFPTVSGDALIQPDWISAAVRREIIPDNADPGQGGLDVARFGDDETILYRNRGGHCRIELAFWLADVAETIGNVKKAIHTDPRGSSMHLRAANMFPAMPVIIDEAGIGGGVVDVLRDQDEEVTGFNGGWAPTDKERFFNARAEGYWHLREALQNGEADIDPEDEELQAQLGQLKWKLDSKGRIKVETKEEYKERTGLPSPNRADAFMYAFLPWAPVFDIESHKRGHSYTRDLLSKPF